VLLSLLLIPAGIQAAPALPSSMEEFLGTLAGIPKAYIGRQPERIPSCIRKAKHQWQQLQPQLAASVPLEEVERVTQRLAVLNDQKLNLQAEAVLELSSMLASH